MRPVPLSPRVFELWQTRVSVCTCVKSIRCLLPGLKRACLFQGGREVGDFLSYLKREATNAPVVQEETKKKKKKRVEL